MLTVSSLALPTAQSACLGELTIPYADLTEATVIGWVKASMGEETVAAH
jgi:hypothetical protein